MSLPKKCKMDLFKIKVADILNNMPSYTEFALSGPLRDVPLISISVKVKNGEQQQLCFPIQEDERMNFCDDKNSWQMKQNDFEIHNLTNWDAYMKTLLLEIKEEMAIVEPSFSAIVNHLHLGILGSCLEKPVSGTFATLVIQLPSKYLGGQSVFEHDTIDYSNKEFASFYTVFYNNHEPAFLPITEGVRVCLIYDLIAISISIPHSLNVKEKQLVDLFKSWSSYDPVKLVYVFHHKQKTLRRLKMRDKAVANLFKRLSRAYHLTVYLGFLKMKANNSNLNSGEYLSSADAYWLTNLVDFDNSPFEYENSITVDFDDQIIPTNDCDEYLLPYKERIKFCGGEDSGTVTTKYFRVAAMVIWPDINLLRVLRNGGADSGTIAKLFLRENGKGSKLPEWARTVASMSPRVRTNKFENNNVTYTGEIDTSSAVPLLTAMIEFNDVSLLRTFFKHHASTLTEAIPLLRSQCVKFGWGSFTREIQNMFKRLNGDKTHLLEMLVDNDDDNMSDEKKFLCQRLLKIILETTPKQFESKTENETPAELEKEQKMLRTMLIITKKLNCSSIATQFAKLKPLTVIVPVLLKLALETSLIDDTLIDLERYCVAEMESSLDDRIISWRCADMLDCDCIDCKELKSFLRSNAPKYSVKIEYDRQCHLQSMLRELSRNGKKQYSAHLYDDCLTIEKMFKTKMTLIEVLRLETR